VNSTLTAIPLPVAGHTELGESPVWDDRLSRLYWVDILGGCLHWLDEGASSRTTLTLPGPVGFACLTDDPETVAVGCGTRLLSAHLPSGWTETLGEFASSDSGLRCNDGKCDPTGRLWAGTMPLNGGTPPGALHAVDRTMAVRRHLENLGCSNGLAWNPARGEFYFIDSLAHCIDCFRWDPETGNLSALRPLASFAISDGLPDGMCIDADGNLWVAFWDGGCLRQIDGRTGTTLARIDFPVSRVTSCAFGGAEFATLYVTTAATGLDHAQRNAQPLAGSVFQFQPGVRGLRPDRFSRPVRTIP
jgi:sugar lactone lactonase YvrE